MHDGYDTFDLVWCEYDIEVSYQAHWLNSGYWHIELRCTERLPVTETGYRSQFVPEGAVSDEDDIRTYILDWLDTAAQDPKWARYLDDSRQFDLF